MNAHPEIASVLQKLKVASRTDRTNSERVAIQISGLVRRIEQLAARSYLRREGDSVVAHAFKLYSPVDTLPKLVHAARLQAAVARFELALRQLRLLPERRRGERAETTA